MLKSYLYIFLLSSSFSLLVAQNTTKPRIGILDLERNLMEKNYRLLAAKYDIDKADAAILQSKLWKNPTLTLSQVNLWSNSTAEEMPYIIGNYGNHQQFAFDLEQVIETAGKIGKRIALRTTEKNLALIEFEKLIRELKLNLRESFLELQQLESQKKQLNLLIDNYQQLDDFYKKQTEKQIFAKSDYYRIQTALLEAKQQLIDNTTSQTVALQQLRIIAQLPDLTTDQLIFADSIINDKSSKLPSDILQLARDSSNIKKQAQQQLLYSEQQLNMEYANAYPDIHFLVNYDRGGGIMHNFLGIGVGIDLPIFDRNQGNIKLAEVQLAQQQSQMTAIDIELESNINKLISQLYLYEGMLKEFPISSLDNFNEMIENYVKHLKSKQVSLFEFIDFAEAYIKAQNSYLTMQKNYLNTFEEIQFLIGRDL